MAQRRFGWIERVIEAEIKRIQGRSMPLLLRSREVLDKAYPAPIDEPYQPLRDHTPAERKAVTRALHSFVSKQQQYALIGGQGRKRLYLYQPDDPLSAAWAKLTVSRRGFVSLAEVQWHLREQAEP